MGFRFSTSGGELKTSNTLTAPSGAIMDFAGASAPSGWAICDGSAISQTTFAALFAVIGTTYNTGGEPGGTFRVPDLRGRVSVGPDAGAGRLTSNNTLAGVSGTESHTLTAAQSGTTAHQHTQQGAFVSGNDSPDHLHTQQGTFGSGGVSVSMNHFHAPSNSQGFVTGPIQQNNLTTGGALSRWLGQSFAPGGTTTTDSPPDHGHNTTISGNTQGRSAFHQHSTTISGLTVASTAAPASSSHNNMQPYIVLNKIIKT